MNFGQALEALKAGKRVFRRGWNGKEMFLYLEHFDSTGFAPAICIRTVRGTYQPGWSASQEDMLAVDWDLV